MSEAAIRELVAPLLPEGTETRGKSNHELLVLAVGDEVPNAKDQHEQYLLGKAEAIAERRAAAWDEVTSIGRAIVERRRNRFPGGP